ncbi:MAG: DUF1329 domain-containing protein [Nevskiales bacterium]
MFATLLAATCLGWIGTVAAQEAPAAAAAPGSKTLTPLGAERAGNAEGTIPAWDGGLAQTPATSSGFKPGAVYPDPFADEHPLFTVTPGNAASYKEHLTPGQLALLKLYDDYAITVYPTHRTAAVPQGFADDSVANAASSRARLSAGGNGVTGTTSGIPFPVPHSGLEAIWNALTRYHGESYETQSQLAAVTRGGDYSLVTLRYRLKFIYGAQTLALSERGGNLLALFMQEVLAPPRLAGGTVLVHETLDQAAEPRRAWTYNAGTRRVRLAPGVAYDNPGPNADGLRTDDDFGLFNGATDRYDWTLTGKREILVPYNGYRIAGNTVALRDLLTPRHLNPAYARYELHRVWVIEARLKTGYTHIYSRRTFYLDEDSWAPLLDEEYDGHGELWRVGENHLLQLWDVPMPFSGLEALNDLQSGRYLASRLYNNSDRLYVKATFGTDDFTPERLRETGLR